MRRLGTAAAVTAIGLLLAGCGSDDSGPELSVTGAYMPQPVSDSMAAGFLTIANDGGTQDELTSVTSDIAGAVTLHETVDSAMQEVTKLPVPADGHLEFESGGTHLMFEKLKRKPKEGDTVSVVLHFADSDPVTVEMPVKPATYTPTTGH
ncbi:putative secreted protein [Streptomyces davaonensis JCM 4913]|uniref:Putative secreted protein n=1 Tax=Streptomyces davaonensis (strain DSM 101723 / JCM 4913 / KCC S-0913 / 768) TaxID=1214101 RepID=K4R7D7_STRDJ|nr:copper chaperone PCu(A)C [Streptomyces davaonensis]CCK28980.1 putative secreted protein [Streptomyces davaonensis JCM 4913]